ncbi:MAG: type II toxin-antitoxin system PemK/MazF family toxin [Candidatus Limnocylindrales bacterium]
MVNHAAIPGNVQLAAGEAQLPKASVVNVTQIFTVDKSDLGEKIGTLPPQRIRQILQGINLVLEPADPGGARD